jgi:uncharacterized protein YndB with AHSA1/START domain
MSTNRIEKNIVLRAPRSRVWRAIANPDELGAWFGVKFQKAAFASGALVEGRLTVPGYENLTFQMTIEKMEPERLFSWRWHPYAIDPDLDYSAEPTTLVEFHLRDVAGGTGLTVIESGFDRIPLARRAEAFRMNDRGWTEQMKNIERHVAG